MTRLEKTIGEVRKNLDRLMKVESELIRTRGGLDGLPGTAAFDVAIEGVGHVRAAVDQAEHELELEAGLYLAGEELLGPMLEAPEAPALPVCPWCNEPEGLPHAWNCPRPGPRR